MSDVHYLIVFSTIFLLLGLVSPLLNAEVNSNLETQDTDIIIPDSADTDLDTVFGIPVGVLSILGNIFLLPFWTFGLPAWVNLWILLPLRIPFIFIIARNIWVGGGG